jgi:hypothetical protein
MICLSVQTTKRHSAENAGFRVTKRVTVENAESQYISFLLTLKVLGLGKPYVSQNEEFFHGECFQGKSCHVCTLVIDGAAVAALDHNYHVGCFKCINCSTSITGPFVEQGGEACCKPCMEKIKEKRPDYVAPAPQPSLVNHQQAEAVRKVTEGVAALPNPSSDCNICGDAVVNIAGSPDIGITLSTGTHIHSRCFSWYNENLNIKKR